MTAPTSMRGYLDDQLAMNWGSLVADLGDHVPDLLWPTSVETYRQMRRHPQLAAVLAAYTLPIRRANWSVNPSGCNPVVVQRTADDFGLPVAGEDTPGAARVRGVSWDEHLRLALLSLPYGHSGFEMGATIRDGAARLTELSERLPATIAEIHVDRVGRFAGITQSFAQTRANRPQIRAEHMIWYAREREGAAWWGTALLRPAYPAWLMSREMLRVCGTSNRRFGTGVPNVEFAAGTTPTPEQIRAAQEAASAARVGETAGAALPPGARLVLTGLSGSAPDTLAFLRYLDQTMARMALASFLDLGTTETGSRALASEFVDLFMLAVTSEALSIADTVTRQGAARVVGWNEGDNEPVPALQVADVGANHDVTAEALKLLLDSGALSADPALEAHVRRQFKLPERTEMTLPAPSVRGDTLSAANRRRAPRKKKTAAGQLALPIAAGAPEDTAAQLQTDWEAAKAELLDQWAPASEPLVEELAAAAGVTAAAGSLVALTDLTVGTMVTAGVGSLLAAAMTGLVAGAAAGAVAELAAAGLAASLPDDAGAARTGLLSQVFAAQLINGYASAAGRRALAMAGPNATAEDVAAAVREHLVEMGTSKTGLAGGVFGAALTAAQVAARRDVFAQFPDATYVAREVNDRSQCAPCAGIENTEFQGLAEAEAAYPVAGYISCLGGVQCRGHYTIKT